MFGNPFATPKPRRLLSALFLLVCSCVGTGALFSTSVHAQTQQSPSDDGDAWLERLAHMDELNFHGVMIYTRGDHQESLRVTHGMYNGELYERLEHLDGKRREVIRHGEQITCIQLGQRLDRLFHRHLLKASLANLDPYYAITTGPDTRIAGHQAVTLQIEPRDDLRFGYRLALDRDTGLLLRFESLNHFGHVLERLQFVEVEIGGPLKKEWLGDALDTKDSKAPNPTPIERVVEEGQMPWKPQWLPPGFSLALAPHRVAEDALTYSDGLAVLSVFVENPSEPMPRGEGSATQGATVAYTRPVEVDGVRHLVLVVGEVPKATARRVAESVAWRAATPQSGAAP